MADKQNEKVNPVRKKKNTGKQANGKQQAKAKQAPGTKKHKPNKQVKGKELGKGLGVNNKHAETMKELNYKRKKMMEPKKKEIHIYDEASFNKGLKKQSKKAFKVIMICFVLLFLLVIGSVAKIEISHTRNGQNLTKFAEESYSSTTSIESQRGSIYDTNGQALAINLKVYDVKAITSDEYTCKPEDSKSYIDCSIDVDSEEAGANIASALGYSGDEADYFADRIQTGLDEGLYEVSFGSYAKNVTLSQKQELDKLGYNWLDFEEQTLRFYPYGDFASYIVGYTTTDEESGELTGALGVEKALDGHLKGQDGVMTSSFDSYGIELSDEQSGSKKSILPKIDGTDVYLTLDSTVQTYLESSMEKALSADDVKDITYDGLFTIVMDVKSGDVLAAQSLPSFDPNVREIENYTNYFTDYCFEPGSTFKTATVAAAYESGVWEEDTTVPTGTRTGSTWNGYKIGDWNDTRGWGNITWAEGYYLSSNTAMTYVMDAIDKDYWIDFVTNDLLIGSPVSTQFFETPSCDFSPQYDVEFATSSFGQGITVNTLQLLRMYSALLNDGNMVTPHIVKSITDSDTGEEIYSDDDLEVTEGVVSDETSQFVRDLMRGVVTYDDTAIQSERIGTGSNYADSTYDIGMKTGTAQIAGDDGTYLDDSYLYSSIATAPIEDPEVIIYTAVIKPEGGTNISYKAFPQYVTEVMDNTLSYLNTENQKVDLNNETDLQVVKDYVGTNVSDIEDNVIKVGTGEVTSQYPKAGQEISSDQNAIVFGTDDLTMPDIKGFTYNETIAVCNGIDVNCEFENTGTTVKSYTQENESKYKVKME